MRVIVTSQGDIAGSNVYRELSKDFSREGEFEGKPIYKRGDVWLIATREPQVKAGHLDEHFDPEYYVFASRHRSESQERTLTVHAPGNLTSRADVGGRGRELAYCNADAMKVALLELERGRMEHGLDYRVSLEATHHGPTELKKPVLFVEVGSTEGEWRDPVAVSVVARAALRAAENRAEFERAVGIGGSHYAPLHTRVALESGIAIGHIIPAYAIDDLDGQIFEQAMEKTGASFGYLDWKGMRKHQRVRVKELAAQRKFELKRGRDLREETTPGYHEYEMPGELLTEAEKIAGKRLEEILSGRGAVLRRDEDGRISPRFLAKEDIRDEVGEICLGVLRERYEVVEEGDHLVLREEKFDLEKALELGLKPGPLFGELAEGNSVRIGGRTITSEMVSKKAEKVLYLKF